MTTAKAHANIALIKYWGKQDEKLFLPFTSSLSLTLDQLYTITTVSRDPHLTEDVFVLNGIKQDESETIKLSKFVDFFRRNNEHVRIESVNSFATAAGLASSASGYAALAKALNHEFEWNYDDRHLSTITRKGSGSATRSLFGGFAVWQTGDDETSFGYPLMVDMDIVMVIGVVDDTKKSHSSRSMMKTTVEQSAYFKAWVQQSEIDFKDMMEAVHDRDLIKIGTIAERNAMMMHATLLANAVPYFYIQPKSLEIIQLVSSLREQGILAYYTMDAGPNVKIITDSKHQAMVVNALLSILDSENIIVTKPGPKAAIV